MADVSLSAKYAPPSITSSSCSAGRYAGKTGSAVDAQFLAAAATPTSMTWKDDYESVVDYNAAMRAFAAQQRSVDHHSLYLQ
jgi:hypothetical protein